MSRIPIFLIIIAVIASYLLVAYGFNQQDQEIKNLQEQIKLLK